MKNPPLLQTIDTPAYVIDEAALQQNLAILCEVKERAGCSIILALKAFSCFDMFPMIAEKLDGTTASGLYEAQLGHTHFGKEVHVYSPAYTQAEIKALLPISSHISFNSLSQWQQFKPWMQGMSCGIRLNPEHQEAGTTLYNPCARFSRLGVTRAALDAAPKNALDDLQGVHIHALCENDHTASIRLIEAVAQKFGDILPDMQWVNFGGGHFITHPDYNIEPLISAICAFRERFGVRVILEPGGAVVRNAGWLVASVLDVVENEKKTAMLDISATAHMPDVLEMPYRPNIANAGVPGEKPHTYLLGGRTCLAGDIIGEYGFDRSLNIGDRLVFTDMAQYTMVKTTSFNGVPLPDIGVLRKNGHYERLRRFGYEDFESRLG